MIFLRSEVDYELHSRVEHLGDEDQHYREDEDGELELADADQQARHEDQDSDHHMEAHVALGADRGDHPSISMLEAANHALLALARPLNLPGHATPPSRPSGPRPSRSTRSSRHGPFHPGVARRAPPVRRPPSRGSRRKGRSRPPPPSPRTAHPPRS